MKFLNVLISSVFCIAGTMTLTQCSSDEFTESVKLYDLDGFIDRYNVEVNRWVDERIREVSKQGAELNDKLAKFEELSNLTDEDQQLQRKLQREITANQRSLEKYKFRKSLGGYFTFKKPTDIPSDLVWQSGMDEPMIGDPNATKGGVYNTFINDFPATLRPFGPEANHSFRGKMYDEIDMYLIGLHPTTQKPIPSLANQWALSADKRTVYYKLDPEARYSNGEQVKAKDYMTGIYVRISENVNNPYSKQYFKEQFANVTVYDDMTLSVTLPEEKPDMYSSTALSPASPSFYAEYGPDYKERYQWRVPPTTGAYQVTSENVKKGRSITLTRVKDWWAKDRKYYRYRNNVDQIRYLVIIYLNVDEGILKNKDVRVGLNHAMNFQRVNDQLYRGDYVRINQFSDGFGRYTNKTIKARKFNPKLAREYFAKAGFTKEGGDGILVNEAGERLSFGCTIRQDAHRIELLSILQTEAKNCGVDLKLDVQEASIAFSKTAKKNHESTYSAWGVLPPTPKYRQFFHSEAAFDETGARNTSSNNMNVYSNERMDILADQVRNARSNEELEKAAHEAQQIIHDEGMFIPGVDRDFTAIGHWRWMKWPDSETTKFSYPIVYEPMENYLYWIDTDLKEKTLQARREGKTFPETEEVIDDYRQTK